MVETKIGCSSILRSQVALLAAVVMMVDMVGGLQQAAGQVESIKMMSADAHPSYEVATIKPSDPDDQSSGFHESGRQLHIENETIESMVAAAYGIHSKQIVDAPDWFSKDHWDVKGVPDVPGAPSWPQQQEMLQKLLAERFGLKFHRTKRELSIYAITVAKGGPKLGQSKGDLEGMLDQTGSNNGGQHAWKYTNNSLVDFAFGIQEFLDRPVVDQTGLKGKFDFKLEWTSDGAPTTGLNAPPGLFTAVKEQLGLKLEATKGPAEVLVIDHAERPLAN